jgi:hypothetical protein
MLEIANISNSPAKTEMVVEGGETSNSSSFRELQRSQIDLPANGTKRIILTLAPGAGALRARAGPDSLDIDNQVTLLPESERLVRVQISIRNEPLREIVESAIRSITTASLVSTDAEIVLTDQDDLIASPRSWIVRIIASPDAESYLGPFVLDRNHPLTEGLSLDGVVWGASKSAQAAGTPVIMAGNVPLLSDIEHTDGAREVRLWFRPELSTLQRTPGWPVLMWNLLTWRASELPGVNQSNLRLGSDARIKLSAGATTVHLTGPAETAQQITALERTVSFRPESPGIYSAEVGGERYSFAVNALRKEESDLREAGSGHWGSLFDPAGADVEQRNIAWVFLLLLMLVLAVHLALASRGHVMKQNS